MPIYEYRCDNCAHEFETIQKVSDAPLKTCPACSQDELRKKISAAGFRLKGGGWYETDFKNDKRKNVAGEKGGEKSGEKGAKDGAGSSGTSGAPDKGTSSSGDSGKAASGSGKSEPGSKAGGTSSGASKSKASE